MKPKRAIASALAAVSILIPSETAKAREARVLNTHLIECQQQYADDRSRIKVIEKSRQTGISYTEAYVTVDETSKQGAKRDSWVSSRDLTQARLFVDDCKIWARRLKIAGDKYGERVLDPEKDIRSFQVLFANGKAINSMSSNPDAQAGKRGRRVWDEAALSKQQRQMWAIMYPGIMWGGSITAISTHRGTNSFFNQELVKPVKEGRNPKNISLHTITIQRAVKDGLWIKIRAQLDESDYRFKFTDDEFLQDLRNGCPDEETWLQEFCCVPADDASALLPWEDIIACSLTPAERALIVIPSDARRAIGFDVARRKDLSVITTLADVAGKAVVENVIVMEKKKFSEQEAMLHAEMERCSKLSGTRPHLMMDETGLGMQMCERMKEVYGESTVTGVMFTASSKAELAFPLRGRFQDRTILIPDDRLYTADLRSVKKQVTLAQNIVITSEGGETDGHADRFWSLTLANAGLSAAPSNHAVQIITKRTDDDNAAPSFWSRLLKRRGGGFF